jgi:predicted phage terminase large subunit-like protein
MDEQAVLSFLRSSLSGYATAIFPEFKPARHHKLLASKLEDVAAGRIKRLLVFMPPRHGKSKLASEIFPAWFLGQHPNKRVLALSYGQDLADVFGRSVRNNIKSPTHQALFPGCQLSSDSNSIKRFGVSGGGGYAAIGVGGATTGRGADLLLLDDLTKDREQADSPTYRENLIDWYRSVARTRLQTNGAIVLVQTRWGVTDFPQWLMAETSHENWEIVTLPAIALENDQLGRQPGEALWPEQYSLEALEEVRATLGTRDWESLYQQCPVSDAEVIFEQRWLKFYQDLPDCHSIYQSWDLNFGGSGAGASWVVGQVWGVWGNDKYLLNQVRQQIGFTDTLDQIRLMAKSYPTTEKVFIELKANGEAAIDTLKRDASYWLNIVPVIPTTSKADRAFKVVPQFSRGEIYLPDPSIYPWVKPLLTELELFPKSATDDCIDAMTQALSQIRPPTPAPIVGGFQSGEQIRRLFPPRSGASQRGNQDPRFRVGR